MARDAELVTSNPRWYNLLPGLSPLACFFTGIEACGALSRDVTRDRKMKFSGIVIIYGHVYLRLLEPKKIFKLSILCRLFIDAEGMTNLIVISCRNPSQSLTVLESLCGRANELKFLLMNFRSHFCMCRLLILF